MKVVVVLAGVVLGAVSAVIGVFVALVVGLAMAGSGDRSTGSDVLFLVPFGLFVLVSLLPVLIGPVRRRADGLFVAAGLTSALARRGRTRSGHVRDPASLGRVGKLLACCAAPGTHAGCVAERLQWRCPASLRRQATTPQNPSLRSRFRGDPGKNIARTGHRSRRP